MTDRATPDTKVASRRQLLQTLTLGGTSVLAGCELSGGTDNPTTLGRDTPSASDHTLRIPVSENVPNKVSFYGRLADLESTFATVAKESASVPFMEPGIWTDQYFVPTGKIFYNWIEKPIKVTSTKITVSIRDDATWSDGHQITPKDIAVKPLQWTLRKLFPQFYSPARQDKPRFPWDAVDDFEISDQTITYTSSQGHFGLFWDWSNRLFFGGVVNVVPTHIEPYTAYADAVLETARRAFSGEIEPQKVGSGDPYKASLVDEHLAGREYVLKFTEPKHVLSTGAWNLVEIRGSRAFVFEKNPHHRNADILNFETLIAEYTSSSQRKHAALKADRLDYGSGFTPKTVAESFPDYITQVRTPGKGTALGLNFIHPAFSKRPVRKALMYALDHEAIANNIHQSTAIPFTTPGGDCWDATDYVSQAWIDENLTTYDQDRARASTLMQQAGYSIDGGQWTGPDGEVLTLSLVTSSGTPRMEPSVASQLSEFGIHTSVRTITDDQAFDERLKRGEFPFWANEDVASATRFAHLALLIWQNAAQDPQQYDIYPAKQFEDGSYSLDGDPIPYTEDRYDTFTIEAPPIGQPDGPLQNYHPASLALYPSTNPSEAEFRRRVKTGLWLTNWFLPTLPITKTYNQHFIDDAHWMWPRDSPRWTVFTDVGTGSIKAMIASGTIRANPDNPEDEVE